MATKKHYTLIDTIDGFNIDSKEMKDSYREFVKKYEMDDSEYTIEDYVLSCKEDAEDDMYYKIGELSLGRAFVTGSISTSRGITNIIPYACDSLCSALLRCIGDSKKYKIEVWKDKIEVTLFHSDNQITPDIFEIITSEKRKKLHLY